MALDTKRLQIFYVEAPGIIESGERDDVIHLLGSSGTALFQAGCA